ncbi:LysR family transcriptional regulator, partial [Arsenophonus endosymbiont of Bemisia tabaci]|uniref:LysR family transcriptional regulator n=1 Tax=Arsenophonus endosymbiont of Bemisia tabaci TaxID=536059 RepID=UPI0015F570DC
MPPLNALRVFDAAARHLSFTKAAEELFVTQATISYQIKGLENFLGLKLFRRRNRSLLFTEEGQSYYLDIAKRLNFDDIIYMSYSIDFRRKVIFTMEEEG